TDTCYRVSNLASQVKHVSPLTELTVGSVEGMQPAAPWSRPHVYAPLSPLATKCEIPRTTARSWIDAYTLRAPLGVSGSHEPRLSEMTDPRWSVTIWSKARSPWPKSGAER